jgi:hypothetical protein
MFTSIGKEIKDKILTGEMDAFINSRSITRNKVEAAKDGKKDKGCC